MVGFLWLQPESGVQGRTRNQLGGRPSNVGQRHRLPSHSTAGKPRLEAQVVRRAAHAEMGRGFPGKRWTGECGSSGGALGAPILNGWVRGQGQKKGCWKEGSSEPVACGRDGHPSPESAVLAGLGTGTSILLPPVEGTAWELRPPSCCAARAGGGTEERAGRGVSAGLRGCTPGDLFTLTVNIVRHLHLPARLQPQGRHCSVCCFPHTAPPPPAANYLQTLL